MFREHSIKLLLVIFIASIIFKIKLTSSQEQQCNPFDTPVNAEEVQSAITNGEKNPDACLCTFPCTEENVAAFVRFYYIKRGKQLLRKLNVTNPTASKLFNYRGYVKFLIHGYVGKGTAGWMPPTGRRLTNDFCGPVILVDYGLISNCSYERSVIEIGPSISSYVTNVIKMFNFNSKKVELVGHSNGAHIAGDIGAFLNGAVKRITGLDPAGPVYDKLEIGLNKSCAQFVQVLHTDPGTSGTIYDRGDVDFHANARSEYQPGCASKPCGHSRALYYYYASLFPEYKFIGKNCDGPQTESSRFGEFNDGKIGKFYFDTTICFPYATCMDTFCGKKKHHKNDCKSCTSCHRKSGHDN